MNKLTLSRLGKTWILDLDGTIVKHNGYLTDGYDTFLEGAKEFLDCIPSGDSIIFLTSRREEYREATERFLKDNGISYLAVIFEAPYGERILINDDKPSGLPMAYAVRKVRDEAMKLDIRIDHEL